MESRRKNIRNNVKKESVQQKEKQKEQVFVSLRRVRHNVFPEPG